ncbi:MAG: methyltransferase domain-containing protein [Myxococcales bacterium]|nr:methyltransferase domain-containing protein [Myxococcales bacterium]
MTTPWHDRWREGRIGFHEGQPNTFLERHLAHLGTARRVLVPLCGKTEDLAYLAAAGHQVVGVELVPEAARAFFDEHPDLPPGAVEIVVADIFATDRATVGAVDALWDRAALIALPADARARYVAHLRTLLAPGARGLIVTIEYPQDRTDGPPFAVFEDELRRLWAGADVTIVDTGIAGNRRLEVDGIPPTERCYALTL